MTATPLRTASVATTAPRVRLVPGLPRPTGPEPAAGPAHRPVPTAAQRVQVLRAADTDSVADPPEPAPAVDPTLLARAIAGGVVEVVLGARSAAQLARWLAPGVLAALRERATLTQAAGTVHRVHRPPVVRRTRLCRTGPAIEVAAVVDDHHRVRAVAARLEPHRGAWWVTALEIG